MLALEQTAGRGSRGRSWSSSPGSLSLSVLLRPDAPAAGVAQWPLLAGVAMAEALARFLPEASAPMLKWPNDLLLGGRKLGGILVESAADRRGCIDWLVIGFGANLAEAPPGVPAAALAEAASPPSPEQAAAAILDCLGRWYGVWSRDGFAPVRAAWFERAPAIGTMVRLKLPDREIEGGFAGLAEDGALLLQTADGLRGYSTGEILFGDGGAATAVG